MAQPTTTTYKLKLLDPAKPHTFENPCKRINEGEDVNFWLTTWAYTDLMTFLLQLNASMFPRKTAKAFQAWTVDDPAFQLSEPVKGLKTLLEKLEKMLDEAPPDQGPRRFGNVSFRKWYQLVEDRIDALLDEHLPVPLKEFDIEGQTSPKEELKAYLMGSFGSAQRLDYGTGHELSFIAFLGGIWKLGGFRDIQNEENWGMEERSIVIGAIQPYLLLIRKLILTYTLEPAGSHGVWGLDDHSFVPYIFGSAQLGPAVSRPADIPQEGSKPDAPNPGDITKAAVIDREKGSNMYFSAIGFIYDVKKGPFWEHSPVLFDVSGVTAGWAKINKGMIKMYNVEVLSKFPVVQHFPFGSLFRWERNPDATAPVVSTHTASQPKRTANIPPSSAPIASRAPLGGGAGTAAPWASGHTHRTNAMPGPTTSWTGQSGAPGMPATRAPWAGATSRPPPPTAGSGMAPTAAPWTNKATKAPDASLRKLDERGPS